MKKIFISTFLAITFLTTNLYAAIITDGDHTIGLYGIKVKNGTSIESIFSDAIAENLPEVFLENKYFGEDGLMGFALVLNYDVPTIGVTFGIDYDGKTYNFHDNALSTTNPYNGWETWYILQPFTGGTVLNSITRMFATIDCGDYCISEEITRCPQAEVPEPASLFLFGTGLLGLGIYRRKKQ